jgi:transcriptional regulator with XRE-family HTH domain
MSAGPPPSPYGAGKIFIDELQHWRRLRGLSQKQLASQMGYDRSYVSKIEGGHHRPTEDFARRADSVLHAGKTIWRRWCEYDASKRTESAPAAEATGPAGRPVIPEPRLAGLAPGQLLVEHDQARLRYRAGRYEAVMRKILTNLTDAPITRYLIRVAVDRYPDDPVRSNRYYREHPLTLEELDLGARCENEPMAWETKLDRDSFKEFWLLFRNAQGRFPLYPGESAQIEYAYTVTDEKWGNWFQRAVRLPTRRLSVQLAFPEHLDPVVWGIENSLATGQLPLRTAISRQQGPGEHLFDWATAEPPLQTRYRLEWRFRGTRHRTS